MQVILCCLIGYLIGVINPSYLIAKFKGFDIRKKGSGNAGASNAVILLGKFIGIFCAIFDIAKAFLALLLTTSLFKDFDHAFVVTGLFCVIGHVFPFYMNFKGGKGLAVFGGIVLFYNWKVFLIMLAVEILLVLIIDYICVVPITASIAFPIIYGFISLDILGSILLVLIAIIICNRHSINLKRIKEGTEMHFSYLWKSKEELERIGKVTNSDKEAVNDHFNKNL